MFLKDFELVPDNFHHFHTVKTTFDRIQLGDGLVSCIYDEASRRLHILEGDDVIGFFYNSFAFTAGMAEACCDDRFAIVIRPSAPYSGGRQKVMIKFYVDVESLLTMFDEERIPGLINALQDVDSNDDDDDLKIPHAVEEDEARASLCADGRLYPYQQHNAAWLSRVDAELQSGSAKLDYIVTSGRSFSVGKDMLIYFTDDGRIQPAESLPVEKVPIKTLLFCDPLGMGKTASTVAGYKMSTPVKTLFVVPAKVHKQWLEEFKLGKVPVKSIVCKRGLKKHGPSFEGQVYLTTLHFLVNKAHKDDESFFGIDWDRVVLDEGHELAGPNLTKDFRKWKAGFKRLNTKVVWLVTATPFTYGATGVERMMSWFNSEVSQAMMTGSRSLLLRYVESFSRKTCDADISKWVQIPALRRYDAFIGMTHTERALYEAERNSPLTTRIQSCSHPRCNSFYEKVSSDLEVVPLEVLALQAHKYLQTHVPRLTKRIADVEKRIPEIKGMVEEDPKENWEDIENGLKVRLSNLKTELRSCTYRNESLVNLQKKINNERCCICFDEFDEFALPSCAHPLCKSCCTRLLHGTRKCPMCRQTLSDIQYSSVETKDVNPLLKRKNLLGSKTEYLLRLLDHILKNPDSRVIIFSRWSRMLKNVEKSMTNHKSVKLSGNVHHMGASLRRFRISKDIRVALLSADVCASGINLTEADHVIILDVFSEDVKTAHATESQAIGRAHRLGQTKEVKVIRLIMKDTVEEDLLNETFEEYPEF